MAPEFSAVLVAQVLPTVLSERDGTSCWGISRKNCESIIFIYNLGKDWYCVLNPGGCCRKTWTKGELWEQGKLEVGSSLQIFMNFIWSEKNPQLTLTFTRNYIICHKSYLKSEQQEIYQMLEFEAREVNISLFYSFNFQKEFYLALALAACVILVKIFHILYFSFLKQRLEYLCHRVVREIKLVFNTWYLVLSSYFLVYTKTSINILLSIIMPNLVSALEKRQTRQAIHFINKYQFRTSK